jgi:A/G-specific adenine glycosylase
VPADNFAARVVRWQHSHGRHDLPWQVGRDPYAVWLSEIMLQQTQVATVKAYFSRFLQRFPNLAALADASEDEVLGLWSGLGYYTRARNLHRCARVIVSQHGGVFPRDALTLESLPGVGRSTAAAIASLCFSERVAILDANVRRVVTRVSGFDADLTVRANQNALWALATALLPTPQRAHQDMAAYTQGMMDLGATLCHARRPQCTQCPVSTLCRAHELGTPEQFPVRSRRLQRSSVSIWLLHLRNARGEVFLVRRAATGIWAGLYCLPAFDSEDALLATLAPRARAAVVAQPAFTHVLTHKDVRLHAFRLDLAADGAAERVSSPGQWFAAANWPALGLPAPVRRLLQAA